MVHQQGPHQQNDGTAQKQHTRYLVDFMNGGICQNVGHLVGEIGLQQVKGEDYHLNADDERNSLSQRTAARSGGNYGEPPQPEERVHHIQEKAFPHFTEHTGPVDVHLQHVTVHGCRHFGRLCSRQETESPWVKQFLSGERHGPVEYRYPATTTLQQDLMI